MKDRRELTRYGVPAAFLAAVTVAVLLIKAGLGATGASTTAGRSPSSARTGTTTQVSKTRRAAAARYYMIQSGDTLGAIALREHTTVSDLLRLNPGIDPLGLHAGSRIRVH